MPTRRTGYSLLAALALAGARAGAQTDGTCVPVAERAGRAFGCFITARAELGPLPASPVLYRHLHTYRTHAAAEGARARRSTVVTSLGRIWLFTIAPLGRPHPPGRHQAPVDAGHRLDAARPLRGVTVEPFEQR